MGVVEGHYPTLRILCPESLMLIILYHHRYAAKILILNTWMHNYIIILAFTYRNKGLHIQYPKSHKPQILGWQFLQSLSHCFQTSKHIPTILLCPATKQEFWLLCLHVSSKHCWRKLWKSLSQTNLIALVVMSQIATSNVLVGLPLQSWQICRTIHYDTFTQCGKFVVVFTRTHLPNVGVVLWAQQGN